MIKLNLQLFGGRGASSGTADTGSTNGGGDNSTGSSGNGTYTSESDFENSLSGFDDPRLAEYSNAYDEEANYTSGLEKNINQAINEDGFTVAVENALNSEEKAAKDYIKNLPKLKTPAQLGEASAMSKRLDVIKALKGRKGEKGQGIDDVNILV